MSPPRATQGQQDAPLVLAIDQGGHATRALAIAVDGEVRAAHHVPIATRRPAPAHVEHDPDELAASAHAACRGALAQLGGDARRLVAVGLATQRSSIVCWSRRDGSALSPVISWQDTRAAAELAALHASFARITELTGLVASPHYGASKMHWCLAHIDAVREAARRGDLLVGPLSSFLTWRLLDQPRACADAANASRTLLWDRHALRFSDELCTLFGVDPTLLPASVPNRYAYGRLHAALADLPLRVVTGDQSAALFAFGAPASDTAYVNLGTGAFMQRPAGQSACSIPGLLNSVVWHGDTGAEYVIEGTVNGAGSALQAVADRAGMTTRALVARAVAVAPDDLPVFLNGVGGLAAPFWRSDFPSRLVDAPGPGAACALEKETLAVLESIAFLLWVNIELADAYLGAARRIVVTGGLARADWLCQALADVTGREVQRPVATEATARGLAWLTADRPREWPAAQVERSFAPRSDLARAGRLKRWRESMAQAGAPLPRRP